MNLQDDFEEIVAFHSDTNGVSRECAVAYTELEEWGHTQELSLGALDYVIEQLATLYGWSKEETAKQWTFDMTASDILDLCDECASLCPKRTDYREWLLRELFSDPAVGNLAVMAFGTLVDACGAAEAVNMVKALVKQRVTG